MISATIKQKSLSLLELQKITGYSNFVSAVVPLGRTFLRRLYSMELYYPPGSRHGKRRLSREARKDLEWWSDILRNAPERSIAQTTRETVLAWSDAASTKGLGGFYLCGKQSTPEPDAAFAITPPSHLVERSEHINTREMRAVEQVLLYWGRQW